MRPPRTSAQRKHREATSAAIKRMVQTCPKCKRRGNFRRVAGVSICHYCRGEF